ncbi:unnamed protein product [Spirodela intermedia]|uniref:Uncharacterized protein n=1 Tax=Spirodela intermedia TaxID=51605 RepID=A0A7I8KM72_SPIIN|nr:unnamed protein product [Spirodela intermedia]
MANKGALTAAAAILLLVLVLFQAIPTDAARRMAQELAPAAPPPPPRNLVPICQRCFFPPAPVFYCPACLCCSPKPAFGCCKCCTGPIETFGSPHP